MKTSWVPGPPQHLHIVCANATMGPNFRPPFICLFLSSAPRVCPILNAQPPKGVLSLSSLDDLYPSLPA